jgi:hypothetical protein
MGRTARLVLAAIVGLGLTATEAVAATAIPVSPPLYDDCGAVSANLVANCGFEQLDQDSPSDWTLTPASDGSQFGPTVFSHSNQYAMAFAATGDTDDVISQTIQGTQPGKAYVLGYWLSVGEDGPSHFAVTVQNTQSGTQTFDNLTSPDAFGWTYFTDSFVAGNTAPVVSFAGSNYPAFTLLDDVTVQAGPLPQIVSFTSTPPVAPMPGDTYTVTATGGSSGEPVVFATDPHSTGCEVTRAGAVTFTAAGATCRINASQGPTLGFAGAPTVQQRIPTGRYPQTITITSTPPDHAVRGTQWTVTATGGGSNNPVVFSSNSPGVCSTTADGLVSFRKAGQCVILANQAAGGEYARAKTVRVPIVVYAS